MGAGGVVACIMILCDIWWNHYPSENFLNYATSAGILVFLTKISLDSMVTTGWQGFENTLPLLFDHLGDLHQEAQHGIKVVFGGKIGHGHIHGDSELEPLWFWILFVAEEIATIVTARRVANGNI